MFDTLIYWLLAYTLPNAAYVAAVLVVAVLAFIAGRIKRGWQRRYNALAELHQVLIARYMALSQQGVTLSLADASAEDQAAQLRHLAEQLRDTYGTRDPYDVAHSVARSMESIADELDEIDDESQDATDDETDDAGDDRAVGSGVLHGIH